MKTAVCRVDSFESLIDSALNGNVDGPMRFELATDVSILVIHVEGKGYGSFIPGDQLRSLWGIQEDFYRIAAYAIHGTSDIRSLTTDERRSFELKVKTKEGSWIEEVLASDYFSALSSKLVDKMSGAEIASTICICAALIAGLVAYKSRNSRIVALEKRKRSKNLPMRYFKSLIHSITENGIS